MPPARNKPYKRIKQGSGETSVHRTMLEVKLGRKLTDKEVAHHLNEDKSDNSPANLQPKSRSQHSKEHMEPGARVTSKLRKALRMIKERRKLY